MKHAFRPPLGLLKRNATFAVSLSEFVWSPKQSRPVLNNWEVFHPAKKFLAFLKPEICCRINECPPYSFAVMQFIQNFIGCPFSFMYLMPCSQDVQSLTMSCMFWRAEFQTRALFSVLRPYHKKTLARGIVQALKSFFYFILMLSASVHSMWTAQQVVCNLSMCVNIRSFTNRARTF